MAAPPTAPVSSSPGFLVCAPHFSPGLIEGSFQIYKTSGHTVGLASRRAASIILRVSALSSSPTSRSITSVYLHAPLLALILHSPRGLVLIFIPPGRSHTMTNSTRPPTSPSDHNLALYPHYFTNGNNYTAASHQSHLPISSNYSSPSSQTSDSKSTPPTDHMLPSSSNGKRPASAAFSSNDDRKRARKDDEGSISSQTEKPEEKAKPTRGSRYVHISRRV